MPSQIYSSAPGYNKAISANTANVADSVAKAAGTGNIGFYEIGISRPNVFDGDSNNNINAMATGNSLSRAIAGSGIGAPADLALKNEIRIGVRGDGQIKGDGQNQLLSGREVLTTGRITNGALRQLNDGRWVDASGTVTVPQSSGFTFVRTLNASSGDLGSIDGRVAPGRYLFRVGLSTVKKQTQRITN